MKLGHLFISISAAALAAGAANAQPRTTQTTTTTTHVTTTRAHTTHRRHVVVTHRRHRHATRARRGASAMTRSSTTTTTTTTVSHPERYDFDRPDPAYGGYYADRYYRDDPRYSERVLSANDRIYVGQNGRYYCRRPDGTTGLIVGGVAGGALGALVTSGRSETLGTIIGAAAGALAGRAIDQNNVRCR